MKSIRKRWLAFLCIAVMCVTFMPLNVSGAAIARSYTIGEDTGNTLFGARKTLDLQSAGASVQFTDADREANLEEAAQEYDTIISDTLALFDPVLNGIAAYIQDNYNTDITDGSGSLAENWSEILAAAYPDRDVDDIVNEAYRRLYSQGYLSRDDATALDTTAENYIDNTDATTIPGSRMEKYLRYRYFKYLYPDESGDPAIGSVEWYEKYLTVKNLMGNSSNAERSHFIDKRAVQLNSETINERLQSVLSNARFDFYLEQFGSEEEDANGIGSELTIGDDSLTVYNGGFSVSSASSVHLTYVDFSNEDQFYDSELWDALPEFGDTLSSSILDDGLIDGLSLLDHFFLFDGGSLESRSIPYVHMAGGLTYTPSKIWPYESGSKPYEGAEWNFESLANYSIFGDELDNRLSDDLFAYYHEMELTGINQISSTGYDVFIPEFDDDGNIVSVSKPLFYELMDPTDSAKDTDQFDRDTLISSLDLDTDDDGTNDAGIYRYKMVEKNDYDAEVNGQKVVASDDYQIFDVVVDGNGDVHFFVYDDIDDMTDAYSNENVTYEDGLGAIGYGFTINNYVAEGSVTLEAEKTVDGGIPDSGQTFEFELLDEDGNVVSTVTNNRGSVTFDPITFSGDDMGITREYTMVEVRDSGSGGSYVYDKSYFTAEVTFGDSVDESGTITGTTVVYKDSDGNVIDGVPLFKNETKTETTSSPTGSISIHKTLDTYNADKSIFNQKDLSLYGFTLYAKNNIVSPADGTTVLYKAGTAVSAEVSCDKSGNAEISGILPGEYTLKETKMPAGTAAVTSEPEIRVEADDSDSVSVYVNGQKQSSTDVINFENYVSKTEIQKKNESGEYLAGATLQLIDSATGEVQDTWLTGTTAHKIAGLEFGRSYTLREIDAPDGYEKADDITFVTEGAAVQTITMTDSKTQVTTDDDTDDTGNTDETDDTGDNDNTGDNNTTNTNTTTNTSSGNGTTIVNTTSNGGTVSSTDTSDNSTTVQSVKTGDDSMLPETAAVTAAAIAVLGIVLAARKRKTDKR
ncbi:MAG: MSCRAMM family protein [Anaerovoracaceae bacterium]